MENTENIDEIEENDLKLWLDNTKLPFSRATITNLY
jgi:hypothetical protein